MDSPSRSKPAHQQAAEMAVLAQCKFNESRKNLQSLKSCRSQSRGRVHVGNTLSASRCRDAPNQLLSTLLYLSTMLDKVEGMKEMLRSDNPSLYQQWKPLFDALQSPAMILRGHSNQKERIHRAQKRRDHYKDEVAKKKVEAAKTHEAARASESQLQEQISHLSTSLAKLEGRLVEKEDVIKTTADAHNVEKTKLGDKLNESKRTCETLQGKVRDLEGGIREARRDIKELQAVGKEKDTVIERQRIENDEQCKSLEVLQDYSVKVAELEKALTHRDDEISFLHAKLDASDRQKEELAKIIAQQQQQQQQQDVEDDKSNIFPDATIDESPDDIAELAIDEATAANDDVTASEITANDMARCDEPACDDSSDYIYSAEEGTKHDLPLESEDPVEAVTEGNNGPVELVATPSTGIDIKTSISSYLESEEVGAKEDAISNVVEEVLAAETKGSKDSSSEDTEDSLGEGQVGQEKYGGTEAKASGCNVGNEDVEGQDTASSKVEVPKDSDEPAAMPKVELPTTESEKHIDKTTAVAKRAVDDAVDEAVDTCTRS